MSRAVEAVPMVMEMTRFFRAPRRRVWEAWIDVDQLAQWWGPKVFTNPRCEIDLHPGGRIHIDMRAPDGVIYPMGGEYEQIVPPERLVFLTSALDEQGEPLFVNRNTVLFREVEAGTEISIHTVTIEATPHAMQFLKGMREGWSSSLDKFAEFLKTI